MTPIPIRYRHLTIYAIVDDADAPLVADIKWGSAEAMRVDRHGKMAKTLVPVHEGQRNGKRSKTWMARLIIGAGDGEKVVNLDGCGLNCQRDNLEIRVIQ